MNKNLKILITTLVLLISLATFASADSDLYDIESVYLDGIEVSSGDISQVELGNSVEVKVYIEGTGDTTTCPDGDVDDCEVDVKVKVWIGGYEYDDVEAVSSEFSIEPGVTYRKNLELEIPDDLDVEDNDYTLYVEVYDSDDYERESYEIYTEKQRNSLEIMDVIYDSTVNAGEELQIEIRVENNGDKKQEDIKVEVSLEDLDSASGYIDELASEEEDNADEESSESIDFVLDIPEDTESGNYELAVTVTYNNGHESIDKTFTVNVDGEESESTTETETSVSTSSTSLSGQEGKTKTLELSFTNPNTEDATYEVTVSGISQWASSEVSPETLELQGGESEKVSVTITPDSDAADEHEFSIQILDSDGNLIKEIQMNMDVNEGSNSWLKIGFLILIVLIVLIALIVIFKKLIKDDDDDDEDPLEPKEGKTYY